MKLTELTAKDFKTIIRLLKRKEKLQVKIAAVDQKLDVFEEPDAPTRRKRRKNRRRKARMVTPLTQAPKEGVLTGKGLKPQVGLTERITLALKQAGEKGLHLKVLAKRVKSTPGSIRNWLFLSAKKVRQIKKVAPATYSWHD